MRIMASAVLVSSVFLLASSSVGAAPTKAEASAKKALAALENGPGDAGMQGVIARTELAEEDYGLPPDARRLLKTMVTTDPSFVATLVAQLLDENGRQFLQAACGSTDLRALFHASVPDVTKKCHLKERKAAPSNVAATLQPSELLLSAWVQDVFAKRKASEAEMRLARWVSHANRSDEDAKPLTQP